MLSLVYSFPLPGAGDLVCCRAFCGCFSSLYGQLFTSPENLSACNVKKNTIVPYFMFMCDKDITTAQGFRLGGTNRETIGFSYA